MDMPKRHLLDEITSKVWPQCGGDLDVAADMTEAAIEESVQAGSVSIDPATIIFLVQIAITIYKMLKAMGVLSIEPATLCAIFEDEGEHGE